MINSIPKTVYTKLYDPKKLDDKPRMIRTRTNLTGSDMLAKEFGMLFPYGWRFRSSQKRVNQALDHFPDSMDMIGEFIGAFRNKRKFYRAEIFIFETLYQSKRRQRPVGIVKRRVQKKLKRISDTQHRRAKAEVQSMIRKGAWLSIEEKAPRSAALIKKLLSIE